jgi:HSP20 family molecular chaperone IbpA
MFKFLVILLLSQSVVFAQNDDEVIRQFREQRKRMMKQIQDMMGDDFFDDGMDSDFFGPNSIFGDVKRSPDAIKVEETYDEDGNYVVFIMPTDPSTKLDIKTTDKMISISGQQMRDDEVTQNGNTSRSRVQSQFSRTIMVPNGYTVKGPEQVGKKLKFTMIPKKARPQRRQDGTTPIQKAPGDQSI